MVPYISHGRLLFDSFGNQSSSFERVQQAEAPALLGSHVPLRRGRQSFNRLQASSCMQLSGHKLKFIIVSGGVVGQCRSNTLAVLSRLQ